MMGFLACAVHARLKTVKNTAEETMRLLSLRPDRLGHATFLDAEAKQFVRDHNIAIEICLTSNLLCVHPPLSHSPHRLFIPPFLADPEK